MSGAGLVRVGVIGAGGIAGSVHLPSLSEIDGVEIVAVCDLVESRAVEKAEKFSIPKTYTLFPEMLEAENLDAVYVLTEPDKLFRPVLYCLQAGKHVFMEKPPGVTSFQCATLKRESEKSGSILQVGFNRRYVPLVQAVIEKMGELTAITQVEGRFNKHTSAAFGQGCISALPSDTIHAIDAVRWIAGGRAEKAATVEGHTDDVVPNRWNSVIRFDNGVTGIIRANYMTGGRVHGLEIHGPAASAFVNLGFGGASCEAEIIIHEGAEGYSLAATGEAKKPIIHLDGREIAGSDKFHKFYGYYQESVDFIECIRTGKKPLTDISEALETMLLVDFLLENRI